jgi:hypothetical protein
VRFSIDVAYSRAGAFAARPSSAFSTATTPPRPVSNTPGPLAEAKAVLANLAPEDLQLARTGEDRALSIDRRSTRGCRFSDICQWDSHPMAVDRLKRMSAASHRRFGPCEAAVERDVAGAGTRRSFFGRGFRRLGALRIVSAARVAAGSWVAAVERARDRSRAGGDATSEDRVVSHHRAETRRSDSRLQGAVIRPSFYRCSH